MKDNNWRRYFSFSTDHKVIGIQYIVTAVFFLLIGGMLSMFIRAELFSPGMQIVRANYYNGMVTAHGTVMIFLWLIPGLVGLANFMLPLMIGARDMAFPRLNALSFWLTPPGGLLIVIGLLVGPAQAGWTSYAPLSLQGPVGQTLWIIGLILIGSSSIMGAVNFMTTVITLRAPGMTVWRMPLFVWTMIATSILILGGTPVLAAGLFMQLFDRVLGSSFFVVSQGGAPVLWEHLFWFYSHPAVYIMVLPGMGIISEVVTTFARKPIFGYKAMAISSIAIALIGFLVWAHHMFTSGVAPIILLPMMITSMIIAVPTGIKTFGWLATLWRGKLWMQTPLLFAIAFLSQFVMTGITGVMQASIPLDIHFHNTYWLVGHLHYALFGTGVFALLSGIYYWFPKITGRMYNETLGKVHFYMIFIAFQCTYFPMYWLGLNGMPRRVATYMPEFTTVNRVVSIAGFCIGLSFAVFLVNLIYSWRFGPVAGRNPWRALTLEWTLPSPPPEHNFDEIPTVTTYPYDYGRTAGTPVEPPSA